MSDLQADNQNKKRGLGRGLGSLLGGAMEQTSATPPPDKVDKLAPTISARPQQAVPARQPVASAPPQKAPVNPAPVSAPVATPAPVVPPQAAVMTEGKVWQISIDKLKSGVYQPRQNFDKEALLELAQSIKENGILQPIIVRKTTAGHFEIVAGERRWRAAQLAGMHEVPVLIRQFEDKEALELAIVENIQREDLDPIEEAKAYSRLISEFHLSQQQVAEKVGRERATIANAVRLLALPEEIRHLVQQGEVTVGHAKVLLGLPDPKKQIELAKQCQREQLSVRKLEKLVAQTLSPKEPEKTAAPGSSKTMEQLVQAVSEELQRALGTKVTIDYNQGKGRINLSFYSDEELNRLVDRLKESR